MPKKKTVSRKPLPVTRGVPEAAGAPEGASAPSGISQGTGKSYFRAPGIRGDRPKDIGKFVRHLFEVHEFSAIEELVLLAKNPPADLKTGELITVLKHLSDYEAPKAKSESLVQQGAQSAGIHIQVVQFGQQAAPAPRVGQEEYSEFLPKQPDEEAGL